MMGDAEGLFTDLVLPTEEGNSVPDANRAGDDPFLDGPVVVSKFWMHRGRFASLRVSLDRQGGRKVVTVTEFRTGRDGRDRPTNHGLVVETAVLRDLLKALTKAERRAVQIGVLAET